MGVTEEGTSMVDENKNKAGLPDKRVMGFFCFAGKALIKYQYHQLKGDNIIKDLHKIFSEFQKDFPEVDLRYEMLGKEIHEKSGPLSDKVRWLIKNCDFRLKSPSEGSGNAYCQGSRGAAVTGRGNQTYLAYVDRYNRISNVYGSILCL